MQTPNEKRLEVIYDGQCNKDEVMLCLVSEPFFDEFVTIPGRLGNRVVRFTQIEKNMEKRPLYVKRETLYNMGFTLDIGR